MRDGRAGCGLNLGEDVVADLLTGADELGVREGLHAALVDDVIGGQVLLHHHWGKVAARRPPKIFSLFSLPKRRVSALLLRFNLKKLRVP